MTIKEINDSIVERSQKIDALRDEISKSEDIADIEEKRKALENEIAERAKLQQKLEDEKEASIERSKVENERKDETKMEKLTKRQALSYVLASQIRKGSVKEEQLRAADVALGTTATTFVDASSSADGVSNFGVFIPTSVLLDLLREERKLTPILNDVIFTHVPGLTSFPYRTSRDVAQKKIEGKKVNDTQWQYATLNGKTGYLQTTLRITQEVMNLAAIDLGNYILNQLLQDFTEDWASEIIYGDGSGDGTTTATRISGVSNGATAATLNEASLATDLATAVSSLKRQYRAGAKVYLSRPIFNKLCLSKDSHGDFIFPVFSGDSNLVGGVLGLPVEIDDSLQDNDCIIGNVSAYYKANILQEITLEHDKDIHTQVHSYVASCHASAAPVPGAFIKGTFKATAAAGGEGK